jgi:hypothetical protein
MTLNTPTPYTTTLPTWPVTLPVPDRDGYQYDLNFGVVRTEMSGGTVRQRRTVWGMPATFALSFRMNTAQLGTLQTFLDTYGYGWFAMDLVSGAARVMDARLDCLLHRVRFVSNPMHQMIAPNLWRVTITAEVEAMRDPRADLAPTRQFALVDYVTPYTVDELTDWDTLTA